MKGILKIVIIEDNELDIMAIKACAEKESDVEIVASANNDVKALQEVQDHLPHAIILDLELHNGSGDGISFLKGLKELNLSLRPFILVTTHNSSYVVHSQIRKLGADFIMSKKQSDYSAEVVIEFLKDIREIIFNESGKARGQDAVEAQKDSPAQMSKRLLNRLNSEFDLIEMGHKLSGRRHLIETIAVMIEKGHSEKTAIKLVADNNRKTEIATIQAMSNAIKRTWVMADPDALYDHFTGHVHSGTGVPTVTEFIYYYIDKINYSS